MPVVKRFRALGSSRKVELEVSPEPLVEVKSESKLVHRFESLPNTRKVRSDKKVHHFPLRAHYNIWDGIDQLSLVCGSQRQGASLNVICNKLLGYALEDESIVKRIQSEFPVNDRYVLVRSWRDI